MTFEQAKPSQKELSNNRAPIKMKTIVYKEFKVQPYLLSELSTTKEKNMSTALRAHSVRGIRHNFSKIDKKALYCPLKSESEPFH